MENGNLALLMKNESNIRRQHQMCRGCILNEKIGEEIEVIANSGSKRRGWAWKALSGQSKGYQGGVKEI